MYSFNSITIVTILTLLGATSALADEPAKSIKVGYADLDLSTQAGAATLYARIKGAARQVCGYQGVTYTDTTGWKHCFNGAVSNAVAMARQQRGRLQ